jgi:hypothetical protein
VILLVLSMLFSFPIFTVSTYLIQADGYELGLYMLAEQKIYSDDFRSTFQGFVIQ